MLNIFKRKEIKYLLCSDERERIESGISNHLTAEGDYAHAHIDSLYYDTPDWVLASRSLDKPIYKEKLRLRKYAGSEQMFCEIKKKYKGIVYKRRVSMDSSDFDEGVRLLPSTVASPENLEGFSVQDIQIAHEIAYMLKHYEGIAPALLIGYDRLAYEPMIDEAGGLIFPEDDGLRITFDTSPTWSRAQSGILEKKMIADDMSIMEIKVSGSFPLWLSRLLSENKVYPHSFTKYGTAYKDYIGLGK